MYIVDPLTVRIAKRLPLEACAERGDYRARSSDQVDFSGLTPETCYEVEVVFTALDGGTAESTPAYSTFDTPPLPSVMRPVRVLSSSLWACSRLTG